jgi:two-component system, chemotaxis family, sensor kinase Cph1
MFCHITALAMGDTLHADCQDGLRVSGYHDEEAMLQMDGWKSDLEVSEFILRACHDLRSATRAVRIHSELLMKDAGEPHDSAFEQRLGYVVEGARKIDSLVEGLTKYSLALQTDAVSFQSTATDVLLRSVLMKLNKELDECGGKVVYEGLPRVMGDPDRLMQVFESLLRNALLHRGEATPQIHVSACKRASDWLFAVRDNGPGVADGELERIFLPFESLKGGGRTGAGLGLAISRAIVERHGGRMWAESQTGDGATFFFTLPKDVEA